jgi:hypothetical protein
MRTVFITINYLTLGLSFKDIKTGGILAYDNLNDRVLDSVVSLLLYVPPIIICRIISNFSNDLFGIQTVYFFYFLLYIVTIFSQHGLLPENELTLRIRANLWVRSTAMLAMLLIQDYLLTSLMAIRSDI